MMSEKRFIYEEEHYNFPVKKRIRDTQNNETYDLRECCDLLNEQQFIIKRLQRKCLGLEKDYLIETSDISDKIYLEDEIKELKEQYGGSDDDG